MTETIPGTNIPMTTRKIAFYKPTPEKLLKWRKMFLLLSILFSIALAIDLYIKGGMTTALVIDGAAALTMFVFSVKCETLYLKMKIEESLEAKGV